MSQDKIVPSNKGQRIWRKIQKFNSDKKSLDRQYQSGFLSDSLYMRESKDIKDNLRVLMKKMSKADREYFIKEASNVGL